MATQPVRGGHHDARAQACLSSRWLIAYVQRRDRISFGADNRGRLPVKSPGTLLRSHAYTDLAFLGGPSGFRRTPTSASPGSARRCSNRGLSVPAQAPSPLAGSPRPAAGRPSRRCLATPAAAGGAIVCGNDEMGRGRAARACGAGAGWRRARQTSRVDRVRRHRRGPAPGRPGLSTVSQPMHELGERSVKVLLDRVR